MYCNPLLSSRRNVFRNLFPKNPAVFPPEIFLLKTPTGISSKVPVEIHSEIPSEVPFFYMYSARNNFRISFTNSTKKKYPEFFLKILKIYLSRNLCSRFSRYFLKYLKIDSFKNTFTPWVPSENSPIDYLEIFSGILIFFKFPYELFNKFQEGFSMELL